MMISGRTYLLLSLFAAFAFVMVALARFTSPSPEQIPKAPNIGPIAQSRTASVESPVDPQVEIEPTPLPELTAEEAERLTEQLQLDKTSSQDVVASTPSEDVAVPDAEIEREDRTDRSGSHLSINGPANRTAPTDSSVEIPGHDRRHAEADGRPVGEFAENRRSSIPATDPTSPVSTESRESTWVPPEALSGRDVVPSLDEQAAGRSFARDPLPVETPELSDPGIAPLVEGRDPQMPDTSAARGVPDPEIPPGHSLVVHGAGALKVVVPDRWKVAEVPFGRQVRLVLTPAETAGGAEQLQRGVLRDGVWFVCHVRSASGLPAAGQLEGFLPELVRSSLGEVNSSTTPPRRIGLAGAPGVAVDFATRPDDGRAVTAGRHMLVLTEWGFCEIHLAAPMERIQERLVGFGRLMNSVRWGPLQDDEEPPTSQTTEAAGPILGTWKAYQSMLRLRGDGTIVIINDRPARLSADVSDTPVAASDAGRLPDDKLTGKFEARDDLLLVRWDDGSLLNFRWRIRDENLLLTDHQGRTSLLRKIAR